jgi:hypothetical protein
LATVAQRCLGAGATIAFGAGSEYDTTPFDANPPDVEDSAPDATPLSLTRAVNPPTTLGGYVVNGVGQLQSFAVTGSPPAVNSDPFSFDIVRGAVASPDGGHLYLLDGYGGIHGSGIGQNFFSIGTSGGPYWPGWDIARGIALASNARSGWVLDGYGGLHPFGIGQPRPGSKVVGGPYWSGWDIARGVAVMPDGTGGFVLDGLGGLHWFSLGVARPAPKIRGAASWPTRDFARGITIAPDGTGGYVVDALGKLHPFGINAAASLPAAVVGATFARGVALLAKPLNLPANAP